MTDAAIAAAEWREISERKMDPSKLRTYPLAPFLEAGSLKRYVYFKNRYQNLRDLEGGEDLPPDFEQTEYCQQLVASHGSVEARRAIKSGSLPVLSYLTGLTQQSTGMSSIQRFQTLLNDLRRDGAMMTFLGSTDGGKTNTALLLAGLALRDDPEMIMATNVTTVEWDDPRLQERTRFVEKKSSLREVADQNENVVAVLDELSTQANAQTANYDVNEHFYELITFKAKLGLRMIPIFHRTDGYDAAPAFREHSDYLVKQVREENDLEPDRYCAEFYGGIEDGELRDHQFDLPDLPAVEAAYSPDETATFEIAQ